MKDKKIKILLVDDEPDIAYVMEFRLQNGGFDVTVMSDPHKVAPTLAEGNFDILMLDLMMPEMDGFEVLGQVRKNKKLAGIPVLILTARYLLAKETALLSKLKADVMAKPFEPHRLLEKVREMIKD